MFEWFPTNQLITLAYALWNLGVSIKRLVLDGIRSVLGHFWPSIQIPDVVFTALGIFFLVLIVVAYGKTVWHLFERGSFYGVLLVGILIFMFIAFTLLGLLPTG